MTNAQTLSRGAAIVDGAFELHRSSGLPAVSRRSGRRRADVGRRLPDEPRPAADRAERVDDPVVLGEVAASSAVDGHPADRVEQDDVVDGRLIRGRDRPAAPASVAGPGAATKCGPPAPDLDELGEDREGDLLGRLGAEVEPGRGAQRGQRSSGSTPSSRSQVADDARPGSARRPARHRPRRGGAPSASASSSQTPWLATTTYGAAVGVAGRRGRRRRTTSLRAREGSASATGSMTVTRQPHAGAELGEGGGDRGRAGDPQDRRGQMRFHVDLQGATGVAGHDELDDAVAAAALGRRRPCDRRSRRLAVGERAERLADDDGLGAAAADPALDRAVRVDDARRARAEPTSAARPPRPWRPRTGGRLGSSSAARAKSETGAVTGASPRTGDYAVTPFSWRIAQTFWGVIGMSMLRTPRCHSASTTALAMAGGAPTVADSPTPLAPIG